MGEARRIWNSALGRHGEAPVVVDVAFIDLKARQGVRKLLHWLRYVERGFPGWRWSGLWGRWYGHYPKKVADGGFKRDHRCVKCGHPVEWLTPTADERTRLGNVETRLLSGAPPEPRHVDRCLAAVVAGKN